MARAKHRLAQALGRLVRSLHDAGLSPHDLSPQNLLVRPALLGSPPPGFDPPVLVTDLDHLYLWKPVSERSRRRSLAQVGNLPEGHVSWSDLWRGLSAYDRGEERFCRRDFALDLRRRLVAEHWRVLERAYQAERARQAEPRR
jgi:hypothetical protein